MRSPGEQPVVVEHRRRSRTLGDDRSRARPVLRLPLAACTGRERERTSIRFSRSRISGGVWASAVAVSSAMGGKEAVQDLEDGPLVGRTQGFDLLQALQ